MRYLFRRVRLLRHVHLAPINARREALLAPKKPDVHLQHLFQKIHLRIQLKNPSAQPHGGAPLQVRQVRQGLYAAQQLEDAHANAQAQLQVRKVLRGILAPETIGGAQPNAQLHPQTVQVRRVRQELLVCVAAKDSHALPHGREALPVSDVPEDVLEDVARQRSRAFAHGRETVPV